MSHLLTCPVDFQCPFLTPAEVAALSKEHPCQCPSLKDYNLCQMQEIRGSDNKYYTSLDPKIDGNNPTDNDLAWNYIENPRAIRQGCIDFRERHKLAISKTEDAEVQTQTA
ncbi:MAG: hypothetical protein ABSF56_03350 [Minisyncoccia bacterium]